MTKEISPEDFHHLVELAALELGAEEAEYLRRELNGQLKAIQEMEAIPIDQEIKATSHGVPYTDAVRPDLREDVIEPCENSQAILAQAPELEENYLVVPVIPHTELE